MATARGAEINRFYRDGWPSGYFYDRESSHRLIQDPDSGDLFLDELCEYDLSCFGELLPAIGWTDPIPFESAFLAWKKEVTEAIVVTVPKGWSWPLRSELASRGFDVALLA